MKIAVFNPDFLMPKEKAGSYIHLLHNQLNGLAKLGHQIYVFTENENSTKIENHNKLKIFSIKNMFGGNKSFFTYHFSGMPIPSILNQVSKQIIKHDIDVIYGCGSPFFGLIISFLGRIAKKPTVYYIYESLIEKKWNIDVLNDKTPLASKLKDYFIMNVREIPRNRKLIKSGLNKIDKLIASSNFTLNSIRNIGLKQNHIPIIYPSINIPSRFKTKFYSKNIVYFGHLRPGRGITTLLELFKEVHKNNPKVKLTIACSEIHEPTLNYTENYIRKNNLEKNVKITGKVRNVVSDLLLKSDVVVLPHEDGHSIKFLETLSAGVPLIATKIGWADEIIKNGFNGILVRPRNYKIFAESVEKLLSDVSISKKISKNARKTAIEKCDIEKNSLKLEEIMKEVIN